MRFFPSTSKYELPSDGISHRKASTRRHWLNTGTTNRVRPPHCLFRAVRERHLSPNQILLFGHETTKNELMILWTCGGGVFFSFTIPFTIGTPWTTVLLSSLAWLRSCKELTPSFPLGKRNCWINCNRCIAGCVFVSASGSEVLCLFVFSCVVG